MTEPFIYIATYGIKPHYLDVAPQRFREVTRLVEEREPQMRSFHFYLDPQRGRAICVQVHADGDSMANHMATIADHLSGAWDWLDLEDTDQLVLGSPPQVLTDYWREFGGQPDTYPTFVAGFARSTLPLDATST
ncbi:MAG TPA: hypothetical protein VJN29_03350 [Intrasporangium sp.]|uniref:hypothetical protein n=1 Tax=Intrasporangium sp. TaxID=1925024 RepID=UPI002B476905|nr:hypothetical protein [Intrasporangium sp.]HKX66238.1 hypothetical protein [Intrasporangium sp.]